MCNFYKENVFKLIYVRVYKFLEGESMTESIGAIGDYGDVKSDKLLKLQQKEQQKGEKLGWSNGFNTNQLGGLLNGSLSATSSQG